MKSSSRPWNVVVCVLLLASAAASAGRGWLPPAARPLPAPPLPPAPSSPTRVAHVCEEMPTRGPVDLRALHFRSDPAAASAASAAVAALLAAKRSQIIASEGVDCRPCSCKEASKIDYQSLGSSYYPSWVPRVTCERVPCGVTGSFCQVQAGEVDVLRLLLPGEDTRSTLTQQLPQALSQRWTVERFILNVTCDCLPEPSLQTSP